MNIDLGWRTYGRLSRQGYRDATGGLNLGGIFVLVAGAILVLNLTRHNLYLSIAAVAIVMVVLAYLQYRAAQLAIRRLHDRGLPGFLFWPVALNGIVVLAGGTVLVKAMYDGGVLGFVPALLQLMDPIIGLVFYKGIGLLGAAALLFYNLFIGWNLGAEGLAGDNAYGPDPREA